MSHPVLRLGVLLLLTVGLTSSARSQQRSDPDFDAHVAHPMFKTTHPHLLVDQGHHNTHTTRGRYDVLANLATNDGFEVLVDVNLFAVKDLQDAQVLLIANPLGADDVRTAKAASSAFTNAEIEALHTWVAGGGSLLLISEHAPMGAAARGLAARFGVDFSTGYLIDPAIADTTFGASTLVFSEATGTLGDHVIIRGRNPAERVKRVRTYTGQSMAGPPGSVPLLKVTDRAQDLMLGTKGMSGTVPDSLKRSAAGRAQAIAFTLGKGRVVMIGETTIFAAQLVPWSQTETRKVGMNAPGFDNKQFALNVLRWLARGLN